MQVTTGVLLEDEDVRPGEGPVFFRLTPEAYRACCAAAFVVYRGEVVKNRDGRVTGPLTGDRIEACTASEAIARAAGGATLGRTGAPVQQVFKLTPRQNELISEALCRIAVEERESDRAPEMLKTIRRSLVNELQAVAAETSPT